MLRIQIDQPLGRIHNGGNIIVFLEKVIPIFGSSEPFIFIFELAYQAHPSSMVLVRSKQYPTCHLTVHKPCKPRTKKPENRSSFLSISVYLVIALFYRLQLSSSNVMCMGLQ